MKVSVITAYYKGREYLEGYIKMFMRNVKNLDKSDELEAIIINDSPDDKLSIKDIGTVARKLLSSKCKYIIEKDTLNIRYADKSTIIRLLTNEENSGIHASRVRGLKESCGDYVIFLDQDDILSKTAVKTYLENALSKPEVLVSNAMIQRSDTYLQWYRNKHHTDRIGDLESYVNVGTQIISPGHCCIYKKSIPVEWTEYICENNGADDYFLWLLMLAKNIPFRYIDKALYLHTFTGSNLSEDTTVTDTSTYEFIEYLDKIDYFPKDYVKKLRKMVEYKADFRAGSATDKIISSMHNLGLLMDNVEYKIETRTPLGFNRE
ncbi:MAG: glycosyltransferase [Lachnospiraceae bacterium]|nr:glycosyltransferase [Lachnospiraceae bacterium]